ncbi:carboxypeptidase-like regulatory domain-containing protein [Lacihabitans sp. CCS-44]|uniref:carboxypeptidase-like regulatory domain-containing protein n=1 Tax=Lacihabitans sp. CCS-44 TaxID=2487331 RepID=UPI0020CF1F3F|nr:carboxypeptidase-like regulatory domain-containing protein [Lacihabitans sp. CCS-44]
MQHMKGSNWDFFKKNIRFSIKRLLLCAFILFVNNKLSAQGGYFIAKGKIVERESYSPLNQAYICIPSTGYGTAPNLDGDFIFQFPNLSLDSTVIVSQLGYRSVTFKANNLKSIDNVIFLEKIPNYDANYGLSDVRIMLQAAIDSIPTNYNNAPYYQNGFYLEQVNLPTVGAIKVNEGVLRVERFPNLKPKIEKVKLLRGRRLDWRGQTQKIEGWGFQNGSDLVCRSFETTIPDFLQKKQMDSYDFRLDSLMTTFEGLPLFIIHFWPLKSKTKGAKEGIIYLEPETKAIVRIEYKLTENGIKDLIDTKTGAVKIEGSATSAFFQYRKFQNKWCLQESRVDFDVNFEDRLDKKYKIDTHILMRYVAFENLPLTKSGIFPNEILLSTNNFSNSKTLDDEYWTPYNHLISSKEAMTLSNSLQKIK